MTCTISPRRASEEPRPASPPDRLAASPTPASPPRQLSWVKIKRLALVEHDFIAITRSSAALTSSLGPLRSINVPCDHGRYEIYCPGAHPPSRVNTLHWRTWVDRQTAFIKPGSISRSHRRMAFSPFEHHSLTPITSRAYQVITERYTIYQAIQRTDLFSLSIYRSRCGFSRARHDNVRILFRRLNELQKHRRTVF